MEFVLPTVKVKILPRRCPQCRKPVELVKRLSSKEGVYNCETHGKLYLGIRRQRS